MTLIRRDQIASNDDTSWIKNGANKTLVYLGNGRFVRLPQHVIENIMRGPVNVRIMN